MSLSANYTPVKQIGNGVTTQFTGAWNPVDLEYLAVYLEDTTTGVQTPQTEPTHYSSTLLAGGGFRITFVTAPTSSKYVVIGRTTDQDQSIAYKTSKGFDGANIEGSFDKLTALQQEQNDLVNRSLKFALGSTAVGSLPTPVDCEGAP